MSASGHATEISSRLPASFTSQNLITIDAVRALPDIDLQRTVALVGFDDGDVGPAREIVLDPRLVARGSGEIPPPSPHAGPVRGSGEIPPPPPPVRASS